MSLIQALPDGPLDVVGDIHGEWEALAALLQHLGYDAQARHPQGRKLVFVGDLCDRGPDSPAVIARVAEWVAAGRAWVTIGNHEINLLANDAKDGSAWFFDERIASDDTRYAPYARATDPVEPYRADAHTPEPDSAPAGEAAPSGEDPTARDSAGRADADPRTAGADPGIQGPAEPGYGR